MKIRKIHRNPWKRFFNPKDPSIFKDIQYDAIEVVEESTGRHLKWIIDNPPKDPWAKQRKKK